MAEDKTSKAIVAIKVSLQHAAANADRHSHAAACMQVLSKEAVVDDDDVEATIIERKVLAKASDCAFLTKLHATFQTPAHLYFVRHAGRQAHMHGQLPHPLAAP